MNCAICDRAFKTGEIVVVTQTGRVTMGGNMRPTLILEEDVEPRTVHHRCLLAETLPAVEDEVYNEAVQRIKEEGVCPMCSPFLP